MTRVTIQHNGFHGYRDLSFLAPTVAKPGDTVRVSSRVARRLNDAVCGCQACRCGEYVAFAAGPMMDRWYVTLPAEGRDGKVSGFYPQHT